MASQFKSCSVDGCNLPSGRDSNTGKDSGGRRGCCQKHYVRLKRYGDPLSGPPYLGRALEWLKRHVDYAANDCLRWPFGLARDGSGNICISGKKQPASRVMCEMAHGEPPSEICEAAHNCGNGRDACVNPLHLRWATSKENQYDRVAHRTDNRGENCVTSKLTASEVKQIRRLFGTIPQVEIARIFRVSKSHITSIKLGRAWAWLDDESLAIINSKNRSGTAWRKLVFERDGFMCQCCGDSIRENLNAHHIEAGNRFDPDNGLTLCRSCHQGFHSRYGKRDFGREQLNEYLAGYRCSAPSAAGPTISNPRA